MPLDWLNTPLDADIGELIARKKRARAIETLRRQLQGRLAPPVTVRLQLADLLMQAGRADEAVPVLLGLADEFAADGFVAKAVAILKRVERAQPGRADVADRLKNLVHQQKRVVDRPSRGRAAVPELGIEEFAEGVALEPVPEDEPAAEPIVEALVEPPLEEPVVETTPELPEPPPPAVAEGFPEPAAIATADVSAAAPQTGAGPESPPEVAPSLLEPVEPGAFPEPATSPEGALETAAEGATGANPGVGRRIRRALWRFLASLPGAEETGPGPAVSGGATAPDSSAASTDVVPSTEVSSPEVAAEAEPIASDGDEWDAGPGLPSEPAEPGDASDTLSVELMPGEMETAPEVDIEFETPPPRPRPLPFPALGDAARAPEPTAEPEPGGVPAGEAAGGLSDEAFRANLLDIVEDVLHRPPPPHEEAALDRARVLDLARRLVASRLFQDLSDEELLAILRALRLRTFEPGDIVVTEGEPGQSLFTITSGHVKVFIANPDGRNFEVNTLSEGDFFGEISSLSGRPRSATVVAATASELLELDRPTLDSIARTHARVRDVLESAYIERASSPEAAAVRAVSIPDSGSRRKAIEVLEAHFGESRWDPRMRLRLADVLLKAGKQQEAIPILVGLADELAREGFADKAVAILKKIEQVQRRNVEVVNLAPLIRAQEPSARRPRAARARAAPEGARSRPVTDEKFHGWLLDLVRDTVTRPQAPTATLAAEAPALKAYGPGLLANPLFEDFTEEELVAFIRGLKLLTFEPGDVIITEGEAGQSVFILTTGRVKVFVRGPGRASVLLGALTEGSFFGEISTLSGRPRTATITAAAPCEILELDRAGLDAVSAAHPRVRDVLEAFSAARSSDPEAARARGGQA